MIPKALNLIYNKKEEEYESKDTSVESLIKFRKNSVQGNTQEPTCSLVEFHVWNTWLAIPLSLMPKLVRWLDLTKSKTTKLCLLEYP